MNTKKIIIIGLIVSLVIVPVFVYLIASRLDTNDTSYRLTNTPPTRTSEEISEVIAKSNSSLQDNAGKPNFKLVEFKKLAGNWYIAWIENDSIKVLINDPAESPIYMRVFLGPATVFDQNDAVSKGVPLQVFKDFEHATR